MDGALGVALFKDDLRRVAGLDLDGGDGGGIDPLIAPAASAMLLDTDVDLSLRERGIATSKCNSRSCSDQKVRNEDDEQVEHRQMRETREMLVTFWAQGRSFHNSTTSLVGQTKTTGRSGHQRTVAFPLA